VQFKLKATELGQGDVRVEAFHGTESLGAIRLAPLIVVATETVDVQPQTREQEMAPIRIQQPDLSLLILQTGAKTHSEYIMRLTASDPSLGLFFKSFPSVTFATSAADYFKAFFEDIEKLKLDTPEQRKVAQRKLEAKGAELFANHIPEDLQVLLWKYRDRIKTVQILSEEPWIPWELCRLGGDDGMGWEPGPFLCEAFSVTRWIPGIAPRQTLTLNRMALVVPRKSRLKHAAEERDYMLKLPESIPVRGGERQVERITATYLDVTDGMSQGVYDGWHFTGHGTFRGDTPDRSTIKLEGKDELTPGELLSMTRNLGKAHPLVFLNACQVGQAGMSLTGAGGWARRLLKVGAGAFIGALWSISDRAALDFAKGFYDRLLRGKPIGEAVQEARLAIRAHESPTWLAYTVFADPFATVQT
jgi:hypothetical protein